MTDVTQILQNWSKESPELRGQVIASLYRELRQTAARHLDGERHVDLQPTSLVNEAYLRLIRVTRIDLAGRTHFFGLAGRIMREVLVDEARRMRAQKRDRSLETKITGEFVSGDFPVDGLVELDDLLTRLGEADPVYLHLIDARVFAGMTLEEAANLLQISIGTAKRKWKVALAWIKEHMGPTAPES